MENGGTSGDRSVIGKTAFRLSGTEPRSLNGWFGVIRYHRSYADR